MSICKAPDPVAERAQDARRLVRHLGQEFRYTATLGRRRKRGAHRYLQIWHQALRN
jgi:hypothetical protein